MSRCKESRKNPLADLGRWCWGWRRAREIPMQHCTELSQFGTEINRLRRLNKKTIGHAVGFRRTNQLLRRVNYVFHLQMLLNLSNVHGQHFTSRMHPNVISFNKQHSNYKWKFSSVKLTNLLLVTRISPKYTLNKTTF